MFLQDWKYGEELLGHVDLYGILSRYLDILT